MTDTLTTLSPIAHRLLLAVRAEPDNWDLRRVYADCLEEGGEMVLANGQRWQASMRYGWRRPQQYRTIAVWHGSGFRKAPIYSRLPRYLIEAIGASRREGIPRNYRMTCYCYASVDAAEHALARALWSLNIFVAGDQC